MDEENETSALYSRRKKSSMKLSSCFSGGGSGHRRGKSFDVSSSSSSLMSPSTWIRSKTHEQLPVPEIKGKYKKIIPRAGRHRRHSSADFSYDPMSYALNFEDNDEPSERDYEPLRSFSSRLPASPPTERATIARLPFEPSPSGRMSSMTRRTSELPASRALAVAEVRKSLELPSPGAYPAMVTEARKSLELPTQSPRIEASRRSAETGEVTRTHDLPTPEKAIANAAAEPSKSIGRSTPRAAAVAEVRRSLEDATPSHSRQVLVELL